VILPDGRSCPARLAGRDPGSDLAVLRLEKPQATPAERASEETRVGQIVLAIGRPGAGRHPGQPGRDQRHRRAGAHRQRRRARALHPHRYHPFPGFSGGPLVDSSGRVVGLNTSGFGRGAAITIPADLAWKIAETPGRPRACPARLPGHPQPGCRAPCRLPKSLGRDQAAGLLLVGVEKRQPGWRGADGGRYPGRDCRQAVVDHDQLMAQLSTSVVDNRPRWKCCARQPVTVDHHRGKPLKVPRHDSGKCHSILAAAGRPAGRPGPARAPQPGSGAQPATEPGPGSWSAPTGLVLTNNHVLGRHATRPSCWRAMVSTRAPQSLRDPEIDLALLQIAATGPAIDPFASEKDVRIGELAFCPRASLGQRGLPHQRDHLCAGEG